MYEKTISALVIAAAGFNLAACSTATPQTAAQYAPKVVVTGVQPISTTPAVIANTGSYPTFGPPLTAANSQMDDAEAVRIQAQMASLSASHSAGALSDAEYKKKLTDLNLLAATHGAAMQAKIAN